DRAPEALAAARERSAAEIEAEIRRQLQFARAWDALRAYAHRRGVRVFGDLPIYVAPDAVDCWVRREQFLLDEAGYPRAVAGVPPDYFAATGQLWGNPLYDWEQAQRDNFGYFRARVAAALRRFDLLRIDHFRALQSHWAVPADAPDARAGSWQPTPGRALLAALCQDHPDRPFVAEDLGAMTPQVTALRDEFALPGMQVLQFAFDGDPANAHWPAHGPENAVAYVGTHDNDTALGWVRSCDPQTLQRAEQLLGVPAADLPQAMIDAVLAAPARLAVLTMPDLLGLGSEARFNTPGTATGNWQWRLPPGALRADLAERLRARVAATARLP
ncbi:MAG: 4-alpha-glucanotransferase, partial [Gammaproteobacteria bacterium]|nr:4-alpha-glucanotransferase [Gammaproteobacteria bacterium]